MTVENTIKSFGALVALAGFIFGVFKFLQVQAIEAEKPYLERKLAWCEEAVETTSRIAISSTPSDVDIVRFWEMYWGVMGMIENESVTPAMIAFGEALKAGEPAMDAAKNDPHASGLTKRSLDLAHACRRELSLEWSTSWARK